MWTNRGGHPSGSESHDLALVAEVMLAALIRHDGDSPPTGEEILSSIEPSSLSSPVSLLYEYLAGGTTNSIDVSLTDDPSQDLSRQCQHSSEYATDRLGFEPAEIVMFVDKQTETNTGREGYRELMSAIKRGKISQVIASEVSRISRSIRDFSATVELIVDENDVGLHILDMGIALNPSIPTPTRARS